MSRRFSSRSLGFDDRELVEEYMVAETQFKNVLPIVNHKHPAILTDENLIEHNPLRQVRYSSRRAAVTLEITHWSVTP
jgi:hypothetical protein